VSKGKFTPAFPGDMDPTEIFEACGVDGFAPTAPTGGPPGVQAFRGNHDVERVHEDPTVQEEQEASQGASQATGGSTVKEALLEFIKASERQMEAGRALLRALEEAS